MDLFLIVELFELRLQGFVGTSLGTVSDAGGLDRIEEQRWRDELIEDKDHRPDEENAELHGDLQNAVGQ